MIITLIGLTTQLLSSMIKRLTNTLTGRPSICMLGNLVLWELSTTDSQIKICILRSNGQVLRVHFQVIFSGTLKMLSLVLCGTGVKLLLSGI